MTGVKDKLPHLCLVRQTLQPALTPGARMINGNHGTTAVVQGGIHVHCLSVHNTVLTAVKYDSLHVLQFLQFLRRNVVGMDLAVHPKAPDLPGNRRIFRAAQVKNYNHVLLHSLFSRITGLQFFHLRSLL